MTMLKHHDLIGYEVLIDDPSIIQSIGEIGPIKAIIIGVRSNFGRYEFKFIVNGKPVYLRHYFFKIIEKL